jgi:hypothetical protein
VTAAACRCRIAIEESNTNANFALKQLDPLDRTVWATLQVGLSLHEAGLMSWELKLQHMGARPITGIQCFVGRNATTNASRAGSAWRGPYMGVGRRDLGTWQPFQPVNFVTPPFPGYVSGHATFSAAAAEVRQHALQLPLLSYAPLLGGTSAIVYMLPKCNFCASATSGCCRHGTFKGSYAETAIGST